MGMKVITFCSRNKDNKNVKYFKERRKVFLSDKEPCELLKEFDSFRQDGVCGELSRFYYTVNDRDEKAVRKNFLSYLILNEEIPPTKYNTKLCSIASKIECAKTKKWLFDVDYVPKEKWDEFCNFFPYGTNVVKTVHGYAFVTPHGFDTRDLFKWCKENDAEVENKRDGRLCYFWEVCEK